MHIRLVVCCALWALGCTKPAPTATVAPTPAGTRTLALKVTEAGFEPANHTVKKGEALKLIVTRVTDSTCATDLLVEGTDINVPLPLNKPVEIAWTPSTAGSIKYGCAMDKMVGGVLLVE